MLGVLGAGEVVLLLAVLVVLVLVLGWGLVVVDV